MNIIFHLYDFLTGMCLYFSVALCVAGLTRKTVIIVSGRLHGLRFPVYRVGEFTSGESEFIPSTVFAGTIVLRDPILAAASLVFHISVTTVPLTAGAHMILFNQAWHVMPPLFNAEIPLILSWTGIATGLFLLLRRTFLKHVRAVSSWKDYAAMTCVLAPLITGLIARLNPSHYEIIVLMHCISAHILLVAIGWTRLGHFVFFTTGRFPVPDILTVNRLW